MTGVLAVTADTGLPELGALVAAVLGVAGLIAYFRGNSRWYEHPGRIAVLHRPRAGAAVPAATGAPAAHEEAAPQLAAARARLGDDEEAAVPPPEPRDAWTAEIAWEPDEPRFAVRAVALSGAEAVLATTPRVAWPPADEAAVQALADAVARLEARLLQAGWAPAGGGERWYARRFAWSPQAWSTQTWRCEITWHAGTLTSRFSATAFAPGTTKGRAVGRSAPFRWVLTEAASQELAEDYAAAVEELAARLERAGWTPAGAGSAWFARRFTWTQARPPGDLPPPGTSS